MKRFLLALGLGASLMAVAAPADARPGDRDRGRHDQRWDRHDNGRHNGWNRDRRRGSRWQNDHRRHRYSYYRHGRRYYGWR